MRQDPHPSWEAGLQEVQTVTTELSEAMRQSARGAVGLANIGSINQTLQDVLRLANISSVNQTLQDILRLANISSMDQALKNAMRLTNIGSINQTLQDVLRLANIRSMDQALKDVVRLADLGALNRTLNDAVRLTDLGALNRSLNDHLRLANTGSIMSQPVRDALRFAQIGSIGGAIREIVRTAVPEIKKISAEEISQADVGEAVAALETNEFQEMSAEEKLDYLYQQVKKEKDRPLVRIILFFILMELAKHLFTDAWSFSKDYITNHVNVRQLIKNLLKATNASHQSKTELRDVRVVARSFTTVHASYKRRSPQTAILGVGSSVRVIRRRKKWSFVEWLDDWTGEMVRGWVRNKYLKRLVR